MDSKPILHVKQRPIILKKGAVSFLKGKYQNNDRHFTPNMKISPVIKENVLYETTDVYYLKGEFQRMTLVHHLNVVTKVSRTIAKYFSKDGTVLEKTSDGVTQFIGQEQYRTVFTALCSIIDEELKIRSILALLTIQSVDVKIERLDESPKEFNDKSSQTPEMRIEQLKSKPRRRIRKQPGPYIVQDNKSPEAKKRNKIIVNFVKPNPVEDNVSDSMCSNIKDSISVTSENSNLNEANNKDSSQISNSKEINQTVKSVSLKRNSTDSLLDLGYLHDDFTNESIGKYSTLSDTPTFPELLTNPTSILHNVVDQHTKTNIENYTLHANYKISLMDGTDIIVPYKPEDVFHIATKENLQYLDPYSRKKLLTHQMMLDFKHCLTVMDEHGNLPLHLAVLNNDLELLSRQCVVLKIRGKSVDIPANGLTALKLSLFQASSSAALTACLVRHGADPLRADGAHRACAHVAAEADADALRAALGACRDNARKILSESEELWKPEMESQADEELAQFLMQQMCSMFDKQGYTPLMLASMLGLYENVRVLLEHSPQSVNDKMPTSGNTALYLTVAAACNTSSERGNKSIILDHFRKTIELLLEHGADPAIDNYSGTNVNVLLTEFNCAELSMLIANKLTHVHLQKSEATEIAQNFDKLMLVMDKDGKLEYHSLENEKKKKVEKKLDFKPEVVEKKLYLNPEVVEKKKTTDNKPVIVENILLKSPGNTENARADNLNSQIVESTKVNLQQIVLTGKKERHSPPILKNKNLIILGNIATPQNQGQMKRKMEDEPKVMKQAKVDK